MPAPSAITRLVDEFRANEDRYTHPSYKEYSVRSEFINPLFEALGWSVTSTQGVAPEAREVVFEDTIHKDDASFDAIEKIVGKIPDYSFRIDGKRKFYVEAKKPYENLDTNRAHAFQVRAYGWSARLPISILTDFQQFSVYDCRIRPEHSDRADLALLQGFRLTYEQYVDRWDDIAALLHRDSVAAGSVDRLAEKRQAGAQTVDAAFLKEISEWREILAQDLATRNPGLSQRDLNYAVQMTINRIIFLRIAEDRGIEPEEQLKLTLKFGGTMYPHLVDLFTRAHERYNSGLFHFKQERAIAEQPDEFTLSLDVGDEPITRIIRQLYYPSPYKFDVIPIEILGQVYEQFLGKVIRFADNGPQTTDDVANNSQIQNPKSKIQNVVIEDKPEVRKAGGVYYTPTYIVDYIVEQTVGRLLEGKTPKEAAALRILDPACGSGSFLIGAYSYLLDWHLRWYAANSPAELARTGRGRTPVLVPIMNTGGGAPGWKLSLRERKKILQNNIYGVDIDAQAVEVTKLSLLLKVLEGETSASLGVQLGLAGVATAERVLPDLGDNIKSGNSLIGPDFYTGTQATFLDREEQSRINAFDWQREFAAVMRAGGFDAVIGNPPYVRPHNLEAYAKEYYWKHYETFVAKADLYCCFVEQAIELLKNKGSFGFIISDGWLRLDSFENMRIHLLDKTAIKRIIDFTNNVFANANVKSAILIFSKEPVQEQIIEVTTTPATAQLAQLTTNGINQDAFRHTYKHIFDLSMGEVQELIKEKIRSKGTALGQIFNLAFGLKTGDDSRFLTYSAQTIEHKPLLRGEDVHRYSVAFKGEYVWYVPSQMREHRKTARPGTAERFEQPKVLIRDTGGALEGTFDGQSYYVKDVLIVSKPDGDESALRYLTGILNSTLMKYYYETSFPTLHVQRDELSSLPIRTIDFSSPTDKARHDNMVALVERMLTMHRDLPAAKSPYDKQTIERQIEATDAAIDRLVYDLYGLTEEEIGVVEGT